MKLYFLKQWLTGDTDLPGVDLHKGKTSCQLLVTDIEKKKKEEQNCRNIAKDGYAQAILCVGEASFSSEERNGSFSKCFIDLHCAVSKSWHFTA